MSDLGSDDSYVALVSFSLADSSSSSLVASLIPRFLWLTKFEELAGVLSKLHGLAFDGC